MIEDKELPSEYVSIRAIWLKGIEECRKAISQVANIDTSSERKEWALAGPRTVVHTVDALYLSLVDYGEALIKTDVDKWRKEYYWPEHDKIWNKKTKKDKTKISFTGLDDEEEEEKETYKELDTEGKWWANFRLSRKLYEKILQVLNKYNMLFPEQPAGYSNISMESV